MRFLNKIFFKLALVATILVTSACAFVPRVSHQQEYLDHCDMESRKYTLDVAVVDDAVCHDQHHPEACLLIYGVIIPAGSFILSSSFVLMNNTYHWLEYKTNC